MKHIIPVSLISTIIVIGFFLSQTHITLIRAAATPTGVWDPPQKEILGKINILLVPGHEPDAGGAQFGKVYERLLTAELGEDLERYLSADSNYRIFMARDEEAWNPILSDYFKNNWQDIKQWAAEAELTGAGLASAGSRAAPGLAHNKAPTGVATRLYGITKWANENDIDLIIHLHFNDYPGHSKKAAGKYNGLVIFVPIEQYSNGAGTREIADTLFKRLTALNPVDNLPVESNGLIDDPDLIAIGANNTSDAASMLIEYDYLYQPQFSDPKLRPLVLEDLAYQTYLGLRDHFSESRNSKNYTPAILYAWSGTSVTKNSDPRDIYSLQTALMMANVYPPPGKTKNDCPRTGIFGPCTRSAIDTFQKKYGILDEAANGPRTLKLLADIYAGSLTATSNE